MSSTSNPSASTPQKSPVSPNWYPKTATHTLHRSTAGSNCLLKHRYAWYTKNASSSACIWSWSWAQCHLTPALSHPPHHWRLTSSRRKSHYREIRLSMSWNRTLCRKSIILRAWKFSLAKVSCYQARGKIYRRELYRQMHLQPRICRSGILQWLGISCRAGSLCSSLRIVLRMSFSSCSTLFFSEKDSRHGLSSHPNK